MSESAYAWAGHVSEFVETSDESLLQSLTRFTRETGAPQLLAWHRSIGVFKEQLGAHLPEVAGMGLVLEFELPRTGGRRPDLILLENGTVVVVEFKNRVEMEPGDIAQVQRYVRDLEDYHAGCRGRRLVPILIPMGMQGPGFEHDGIFVVPPRELGARVRELAGRRRPPPADVGAWTSAPYEPLPGLIEAARLLFERQPLPRIRRAESARVPETVSLIESVVSGARTSGSRFLVLLSGVPGSGKTLVGLQLVHSRALDLPAIFLSGNGPLVQVLQYELGGGRARREFVQELRVFVKDHFVTSDRACKERVLVFDEAQRAWDADRVLTKYRGQIVESQPQLFVRLAERVPGEPFVIVALIGDGQEIHAGEERGMQLWVDAVSRSSGWTVIGPEHLVSAFSRAGLPTRTEPRLGLTLALRSHRASQSATWVDQVLSGRLPAAATTAESLRREGFELRVSRDLEDLRQRVRDQYDGDPGARYGLVVSSKFRAIASLGVEPLPSRYWYYGEWYGQDRIGARSAARLETAVTEFGCQGLELDLPVLCWGPDLTWSNTHWEPHVRPGRGILDPRRLRVNAYRVLMSRGRDGLYVFVPREPRVEMDATFEALIAAGMRTGAE